MKETGMDDWFIDVMIESYSIIRAGHASGTATLVKQITGRNPILFAKFARDHAHFFNYMESYKSIIINYW